MFIRRILKIAKKYTSKASWEIIFCYIVFHLSLSYIVYSFAGEKDIVNNIIDYLYFCVVTGSTVGFGDISPTTPIGKIYTLSFFAFSSLAIFATVFGKIVAFVTERIKRPMTGFADFSNKKDHMIIFGYIPEKTKKLIDEIRLEDKETEIVICHEDDDFDFDKSTYIDGYVKSSKSLSQEVIKRTGIAQAKTVLVMDEDDDRTASSCMAINNIGKDRHIVAYFYNECIAETVSSNFDNVEPVISNSVEQMVRSMIDPGVSRAFHSITCNDTPGNLKSAKVKQSIKSKELFNLLRNKNAILCGFTKDNVYMMGTDDVKLDIGDEVYYISVEDTGLEQLNE